MALALDAYDLASDLDIVVLVSGDSDYIPLVQRLRRKSCHTTVMSFSISLSRALAEEADEVILLDDPRFRYRSPNGDEPSAQVNGADAT